MDDVVEVQKLVQQLTTVTGVLRTGGFVLLVLVGFVVLFIIVNTIRLAVVARREEIEVMRLVGASDAFIRWPFIFEGAFVGLLGAAAALALLADRVRSGHRLHVRLLPGPPARARLAPARRVLLVVGTGLGVGVLGSWLSVRSYLHEVGPAGRARLKPRWRSPRTPGVRCRPRAVRSWARLRPSTRARPA